MGPDMYNFFEGAIAVTTGRDHLYTGAGLRKALVGKNGQDGTFTMYASDHVISVVTDGCGSGGHSGIGAQIGARLVVESIHRNLDTHVIDIESSSSNSPALFLERIRLDVIAQIRILAINMGLSLTHTVFDYFLFTIVGAIITPTTTITFSIGDGVICVNGELSILGPFPDNTPPYLAYGVTGSRLTNEHPELLLFQVHHMLDTSKLQSLLLGTDGVTFLINAAEKPIPGKSVFVGPISQFWENDWYFDNAFALRRRLNLINRDYTRIDWDNRKLSNEHGHLRDDVAMCVIRRRKEPI